MEKLRKEFPVLRKGIYANTAVYGPLYDSLLDWRQEHDLDFLLYGSDMREKTLKTLSDTRDTVGKFFNCKRENIALINNFSTGLNFLLEGLHPKKKVLLLDNDYPSVNWAFEKRGFEIMYVKINSDVEARIEEANQERKYRHTCVKSGSVGRWILNRYGIYKTIENQYSQFSYHSGRHPVLWSYGI